MIESLARKLGRDAPAPATARTRAQFVDLPNYTAEDVSAYARFTNGEDPQDDPETTTRSARPLHVAIGWIDTAQRKDAIETAKGYAESHFNGKAISSFYVQKNPGSGAGWFWEAHEGGPGRAYLPNVIKKLVTTRRPVWFRVRNRAFTVQATDSRPATLLQPTEMSLAWFAKAGQEVGPSRTRMQPIIWRGGQVLTAGVFTAITGLAFLGVATVISTRSVDSLPAPPKIDAGALPSKQWAKLRNVPITKYVAALRFHDGKWQAPEIKTLDAFRGTEADRDVDVPPAPGPAPTGARGAGQPGPRNGPNGPPQNRGRQPGLPPRPSPFPAPAAQGAPGATETQGAPGPRPSAMPGLNDILSGARGATSP